MKNSKPVCGGTGVWDLVSRICLDTRHWLLVVFLAVAGCETVPDTAPSWRQQTEADLVVNFQSWNAISFIKPDITGTASMLTFRRKTFTREAVVKLLRNMKIPRGFVVVILDRQYTPDPMTTAGGMDEIQRLAVRVEQI